MKQGETKDAFGAQITLLDINPEKATFVVNGGVSEPKTCPEGCVCSGDTVACPTETAKPIEAHVGTTTGVKEISIQKVSDGNIEIKEGGISAVKTANKLIVEDNKLSMETESGNKEIKIMPSAASEVAINKLKLKDYNIELK